VVTDIVAGKILDAGECGEDVAIVRRKIDRGSGEGIIDAPGDSDRGLDDLALDEELLAEPGFVVDRRRAQNRMSVRPDGRVPLPPAKRIRSPDIGSVHRLAVLAERPESRPLELNSEILLRTCMFQVEKYARLEDLSVLGVGRIKDVDAGCRRCCVSRHRDRNGDCGQRHQPPHFVPQFFRAPNISLA
jgi:hypothetical protein